MTFRHYRTPRIPKIKNIESFTGLVMHSRDYRVPEPFQGKTVIVIGCGPSGVDISLEISKVARQVLFECSESKNLKIPRFVTE